MNSKVLRKMKIKKNLVIFLSFLLGLLFTVYPLPMSVQRFRPAWIVILLFAWILNLSNRNAFYLSWGMGFLLDLLNNTVFGLHALFLLGISYFILKFREKIAMLNFRAKAFLFFGIIILYQLLLNETAFSCQHFWPVIWYLISVLFSGILVAFLSDVLAIVASVASLSL